jgi:hypothetical protein
MHMEDEIYIEHTPDHQPGLVTPRVTAPETVEGHRYSTRSDGGTGASEDQIGGSSRLPERPAAGTFAFRLFWFSGSSRGSFTARRDSLASSLYILYCRLLLVLVLLLSIYLAYSFSAAVEHDDCQLNLN